MEFVLRWSDNVRTGNATVNSDSVEYTVTIPLSVEQVSSRNLLCSGVTNSPTPDPQNLQFILLRGKCGNEYTVNANEPLLIYYGGWNAKGMDLAEQWTTALDVSISVDGVQISGEQHPPAEELPFNCTQDAENIYWLYYTTTISKLSPGIHEISVTFNALKALPDEPGGDNYGPGKISDFTFTVTAK